MKRGSMVAVLYLARVVAGGALALTSLVTSAYVGGRIISPEYGLQAPDWWTWFWFFVAPAVLALGGLWLSLLITGLNVKPTARARF